MWVTSSSAQAPAQTRAKQALPVSSRALTRHRSTKPSLLSTGRISWAQLVQAWKLARTAIAKIQTRLWSLSRSLGSSLSWEEAETEGAPKHKRRTRGPPNSCKSRQHTPIWRVLRKRVAVRLSFRPCPRKGKRKRIEMDWAKSENLRLLIENLIRVRVHLLSALSQFKLIRVKLKS